MKENSQLILDGKKKKNYGWKYIPFHSSAADRRHAGVSI